MNYLEYMKFDALVHGPYELPKQFAGEDGGIDVDKGMQWLVDNGYIYNNDPKRPTYGEELERDHPDVYRYLESFYAAQKQATMDRLVEDGYVNAFFENNEIIYRWTAKGVEFVNKSKNGSSDTV